MRALIGLSVLVAGALVSLEHVTQQNPALLMPLWTSMGPADAAVQSTIHSERASDDATVVARPAVDSTVATTVAVADARAVASIASAPAVTSPTVAQKTADVIVPPVKRIKPVTPPAEPVAVVTPEVKSAAVGALGAVVAVAAAKSTAAKSPKVFAGKSALGGPVPATAPAAPVVTAKVVTPKVVTPTTAAKATKQAAAKPTPAPALNKRPGFKLTCTAAQKLDVEKQRCIALKGKLATATAKPKA